MEKELKPCKCGSVKDDSVDCVRYYRKFIEPYRYMVMCFWCGKRTRSYKTKEEAIKAWNKRIALQS
jgi:hypothetical protein